MNVKILNVKIDEFVSYTMSFLNNIQVFHWQTQSYAEHEALGEYYESLTDLNLAKAHILYKTTSLRKRLKIELMNSKIK